MQTLNNFIYHRVRRGHRVQDTVEATRILEDSGIKVAMHMMPGLAQQAGEAVTHGSAAPVSHMQRPRGIGRNIFKQHPAARLPAST